MSKGVSSDAQLQVFTRDGRHLFGSALTSAQRGVMLSEQNGFVAGSTYSDTYLNNATAYRGETWSMGAHGQAVITTGDDGGAVVTAEAILNGKALPAITNTGATNMTVIAAGALKLDGSALPALDLAAGASLTSSDVVNWLNGAISSAGLALSATADNEIRIPVNEISTASSSLTLNGVSIHSSTAIQSTTELVNNINAQSSTTKVEARLDFDGALILSNAQGFEGQTISLGAGSTVFSNLSGDIQAGITISATRSSGDTSERSIALTLSETGSATDLAKLGFATTLQAPKALERRPYRFHNRVSGQYRGPQCQIHQRVHRPAAIALIDPRGRLHFRFGLSDPRHPRQHCLGRAYLCSGPADCVSEFAGDTYGHAKEWRCLHHRQ